MKRAIVFIVSVILGFGQSSGDAPAGQSATAMHQALDKALSRRFEFAADMLLTVFGQDTSNSRKVGTDKSLFYLQRVVDESATAKRSYFSIPAPRGSDDSFEINLMASRFRLDATSVRTALLKRMEWIQPTAAQKAMSSLRALPIDTMASCTQSTVMAVEPDYFGELFRRFPDKGHNILDLAISVQHAASLATALASGNVRSDLAPNALVRLNSLLTTADVSDRVFSTAELRLKLGQTIEQLSNKLAPSDAHVLVDSYRKYVERHAKKERCSDVRSSKGEDMILLFTIPRVHRLCERFGISSETLLSLKTRYASVLPGKPNQFLPQRDAALGEQAARFKNSGDPQREEEMKSRLGYLMTNFLVKDCLVCDELLRLESNLFAITESARPSLAGIAINNVAHILEADTLKSLEPACWAYYVRYTLRLFTHPNPEIAGLVRSRIRASQDQDIAAYVVVNDVFPLVSPFNERNAGSFEQIMPLNR